MSSRKFNVYGYTPENLADARKFETKKSGEIIYIVCPHCNKKVDSLPASSEHVNPSFPGNAPARDFSEEITRRPGAELKCCPHCGGVFLDSRFREAAIGGLKMQKNSSFIAKLAILTVVTAGLGGYAFTSYPSNFSFVGIDDVGWLSMRVLPVLLMVAIMLGAGIYYIRKEGLYSSRNELRNSGARLKNPDYLRALQRLGRPLPVKYRNLINGNPDENRIYRVFSGSCEFCGCLLKVPEMCCHFGSPIATCPQCRMTTYDERLCELAAYPPEMRQDKFRTVVGGIGYAATSETKKAFIFGIAAVLGFLVMGILVYFIFLVPEAPGLFGYSAVFPGKLRFLLLVVSGLVVFIGGYGCFQALSRIVRFRKFAHGTFESELRESERRLRDPDYAAKVKEAISL